MLTRNDLGKIAAGAIGIALAATSMWLLGIYDLASSMRAALVVLLCWIVVIWFLSTRRDRH